MKDSILYIVLIVLVFGACKQKEAIVLDASHVKLHLNNGVLEFDKQPFTGTLVSHYADGQLQSKVLYQEGFKEGSETQWHEDGSLAMERFYKAGVKIGIHKSWWDNGTHKFVYHFNDKGEFHGSVKEWYKDGILFRDFNYRNGKESGSQRLWKPDGRVKSNYEVVNGERFGLIGLKKCYTVTVNKDEIE